MKFSKKINHLILAACILFCGKTIASNQNQEMVTVNGRSAVVPWTKESKANLSNKSDKKVLMKVLGDLSSSEKPKKLVTELQNVLDGKKNLNKPADLAFLFLKFPKNANDSVKNTSIELCTELSKKELVEDADICKNALTSNNVFTLYTWLKG
ncbi:hypothetical protein KAW80_03410 [Candidatus Babeliales bacterium]|nr:hypothetical protein [Candidatus Babeliales bacterium]